MLNFNDELNRLKAKGLERFMPVVSSGCGRHITVAGRKVLNFCSNNYLGLADDKRLKKAAISAIREFGVGQGASRLISGNTLAHKKLEDKLARFKKQESCLVYPTGYCANMGIISALAGRGSIVFSDRLNHASIVDGIILSRGELARYPHKDTGALEDLIKKNNFYRNKLIVSDSIFSMDGDIAPVGRLMELAEKYNCLLMLDEAHATGVLGTGGRGALEHFGLKANERLVQMGTLSKAVGCLGGFVCASKSLISYLVNCCRQFIFTTSLPAAICSAAAESIGIIEKGAVLRRRLWANADFMRSGLKSMGCDTLASQTPIIPVLTGGPKLTTEFSRRLFKEGLFIQGIRPPTVPQGLSRLRITVMAVHEQEDLELALDKIKKTGRQLGFCR